MNGLKTTVPVDSGIKKDAKKVNLKYLRDRDRETVRGKFVYHETPGGTLEFSFRAYKEDPVEVYSLTDGRIYTLPRGVVRHINNNVSYPTYEYLPGEKGLVAGNGPGSNMRIKHKVNRATFQSLEFTDEDDIKPSKNISVVEIG